MVGALLMQGGIKHGSSSCHIAATCRWLRPKVDCCVAENMCLLSLQRAVEPRTVTTLLALPCLVLTALHYNSSPKLVN